jgi:hypothetical protein
MGLMGWKSRFVSRLPSMGQLTAVYGVIVFMVYGWTIYWYLWKLPSWLYFLTLGELLVTFSYAMVVNLIESLLVLLLPVLLSLLLPYHWFRERFVAQGVILVILLLIALMNYLNIIIGLQGFPPGLGLMALGAIIVIAFLIFLVGRVGLLRKVVEEIGNRATIFIYIFLPISVLSIFVVLIRNVLRL